MSGNAPKILIVVLVVIGVLFFVGVGVGGGGGVGSISVEGVINTLSGLFPSPTVAMDEITSSPSDCLDRGLRRIIIPGGGTCELEIGESAANVRSLKLEIAAGGAVHLEAVVSPVEDQEMTIDVDLPNNGKRQINLTFFPSESSILIDECVTSGTACIINLVD